MKKLKKISQILSKVFNFSQGHFRYFLYSKGLKFLLPKHIVEQYEYRYKVSNPLCKEQGECIICGCSVPEVFMADKGCISCYEPMKNKKEWKNFKSF